MAFSTSRRLGVHGGLAVGRVIGAPHLEMLKGVGETCVYHMAPAQPKPAALPDISWVA